MLQIYATTIESEMKSCREDIGTESVAEFLLNAYAYFDGALWRLFFSERPTTQDEIDFVDYLNKKYGNLYVDYLTGEMHHLDELKLVEADGEEHFTRLAN